MVPFNNLGESLQSDSKKLETAFKNVLEGGQFILGKEVANFEHEFSKHEDIKFGVGVASGTDAITLALYACGITDEDVVLTVANSAPATVTAIKATGARIRFADINERGLFDPEELKDRRLMEGVKAIVPVDLYGRVCDIWKMADIVDQYKLYVIEDAAQAAGAHHQKGTPVGAGAAAACYSFYPTKNLGALGDGGMVCSNDKMIADRVRLARNYGLFEGKQVIYGYNSRLDELQAALLRVRLERLKEITKNRRDIGIHYRRKLDGMKYLRPTDVLEGDNCHLYTVHAEDRDHLQDYLDKEGIQTMVHYRTPAHKQPAEREYYFPHPLKKTEEHCRTVLSLPCWYGMKDLQADIVIRAIRRFYHEG